MKKVLFGLGIVWMSLFSCNEIAPTIDFSEPTKLTRDTTYIDVTTGIKPAKNVLIEDISGVACSNCPKAAVIAHDIKERNDHGRVIVMTEHPLSEGFGYLVLPFDDSRDSFNTREAHDIVKTLIMNVGQLPNGAINRKRFDGKSVIPVSQYQAWESYVNQELSQTSDVDIALHVEHLSERTYAINTKAKFYEDLGYEAYISVFLTESHMISKQKMPDNSYNLGYEHNNILRKAVTNYTGVKLGDRMEKGRVFEKGFTIDVPDKFDLENCDIVVLINRVSAESNEVLQCVSSPVKQ